MRAQNEGQWPKLLLNLLLLTYGIGILLGHSWSGAIPSKEFGAIAGGLFLLSCCLLYRKSRYLWLMLCCLLLCLGVLRYGMSMDISERNIAKYVDQTGKITGILEGDPRVVPDDAGNLHMRYIVKVSSLSQGKGTEKVTGKLIVYGKDGALAQNIKGNQVTKKDWQKLGRSGDMITVSGTIRALHGYQNPGRVDTVMANRAQGITAQMAAGKYSLELKAQPGDELTRLAGNVRESYRSRMEQMMPQQDAAAIFAMLFGGYQGIKPELLNSFTATGIVHILSVSGSHITLMAGTAGIIGRVLRLPEKATVGLAALTILFYSLLAGAIPPVIRSALMGIITLLALALGRDRDAQHVLSITALGLLLYNPLLFFDISFQLSFGATAGLLYLAPAIRNHLRDKMPDLFASSLAVTIGAQIAVLPLLAWYFNTVSLSALAANLCITPIVEVVIVIGLFAGLWGSVLPMAGNIFFLLASVLLGLVYELSKLVAGMPGSQLYLPSVGLSLGCCYYLGLGLFWYKEDILDLLYAKCPRLMAVYSRQVLGRWYGLQRRDRLAAVVVCGLILAVSCTAYRLWQPREMQVHFLDVGQGDAALIITPHGHAFMIDTGGSRNQSYNIGTMVDVPYLLHYGVRQLDYIFLTHAHEDHAAGVKGIIEKMPVKAIMVGHEGSEEYLKTFGTGKAARVEKILAPLTANTSMELDGVKIQVLYAPEFKEAASNGAATGNEFSNLLRVSYGKASFLFTGDMVVAQEEELLHKKASLQSTVLKVGHHGSHTSSSLAFLQAVDPRWAVISVGYGNTFGHPHGDILQRLQQLPDTKVLRTDRQGAIIFQTDGERLRVKTFCE